MLKQSILILAVVLGAITISPGNTREALMAPDVYFEEMDPLLRIICAWETRGEKEPRKAVGLSSEFGVCQVSLKTAQDLGLTEDDEKAVGILFKEVSNYYWGNRVLIETRRVMHRRGFEVNSFNTFYFYNAGRNSEYVGRRWQSLRYARDLRQIMSNMAHENREKQWKERE